MVLLAALAAAVLAVGAWQTRASLPEPRSEVAGALVGARVAVVGGFRSDRSSSPRVDLYSPRTDTWTRLPDLPVAVNHPLATSLAGRLYVLGG